MHACTLTGAGGLQRVLVALDQRDLERLVRGCLLVFEEVGLREIQVVYLEEDPRSGNGRVLAAA
jgi:hypothetical protein